MRRLTPAAASPLIDPFGRSITYLRLSVTDRCDLRCVYCMAEHMTFLPRRELLSLEELDRLSAIFIRMGVRKLRITGGEPLVRRNILWLIERIGRHLASGVLDEITLTTNASRLAEHAASLYRLGVRRVNISLDSLDPETFRAITRWGELSKTLAGIEAARRAGLAVKINMVALRGLNEGEIDDMIRWCHGQGCDLTLIEVMPMGNIGGSSRQDQYLPLSGVRRGLERRWTLRDVPLRSGGPARYARIEETGGLIGFITPMTHNFCDSCNRVRLTCRGTLYPCLGQESKADLRSVLRRWETDDQPVIDAITQAIRRKPHGHDFVIDTPATPRHMSVTGG